MPMMSCPAVEAHEITDANEELLEIGELLGVHKLLDANDELLDGYSA